MLYGLPQGEDPLYGAERLQPDHPLYSLVAPYIPRETDDLKPVPYTGQRRPYAVGHASNKRYSKLDDFACRAPESETESMVSLARYLTQMAKDTEEKVRVMHRWICDNISYDCESHHSGNKTDQSPASVLQSRTAVSAGYANLLSALCKEVDVDCKVVSGVGKGPEWEHMHSAQEMPKPDHLWNIVLLPELNGSALVDSCWAAGYLNEDKEFVPEYTDVYFFTRPEYFIIDHIPWSSPYSLLDEPLTWTQFRTKMGSLRNGWLPKTYPESEAYLSVSTRSTTVFPVELESFQGYTLTLKDFQLSCSPDLYEPMPPVQTRKGMRCSMLVTLPAVKNIPEDNSCTFTLKGTVKVTKRANEEGARPQTCTDSIAYNFHAVVSQMDQSDPMWPGPPPPADIPPEMNLQPQTTAEDGHGQPNSGKQSSNKGSALPPGAIQAAIAAQAKSPPKKNPISKMFGKLDKKLDKVFG